jgi:hypothetical protein
MAATIKLMVKSVFFALIATSFMLSSTMPVEAGLIRDIGVAVAAGKVVKEARFIGRYSQFRKRLSDGHHIIQHAAMKNIKGYKKGEAIHLESPSNKVGTEHYHATRKSK